MDLYEALINGTSSEDLIAAFHKDLEEAQKRVTAKKEADKKEKEEAAALEDARFNLTHAIIDYAAAFFKDTINEADLNPDTIQKTLIEYEKEMKSILNLSKTICEKAKVKNPSIKITKWTDDDIINTFLAGLK